MQTINTPTAPNDIYGAYFNSENVLMLFRSCKIQPNSPLGLFNLPMPPQLLQGWPWIRIMFSMLIELRLLKRLHCNTEIHYWVKSPSTISYFVTHHRVTQCTQTFDAELYLDMEPNTQIHQPHAMQTWRICIPVKRTNVRATVKTEQRYRWPVQRLNVRVPQSAPRF